MSSTKRNRRSKREHDAAAPDPAATPVDVAANDSAVPCQPAGLIRLTPPDSWISLTGAASATLDRLVADVRALAALARSTALPPETRVAEAERTAQQHLATLRASLASADASSVTAGPALPPPAETDAQPISDEDIVLASAS